LNYQRILSFWGADYFVKASFLSFGMFVLLALVAGLTLNPVLMYPAIPFASFFVFDYFYCLVVAWRRIFFKSRFIGIALVVLTFPFGGWYMRLRTPISNSPQ
jgi:hypothetical protein